MRRRSVTHAWSHAVLIAGTWQSRHVCITATALGSARAGGATTPRRAAGRSDGYIYNLIRGGGQRMPSYQRIPPEERWHLVNYVRYLQRGGQP